MEVTLEEVDGQTLRYMPSEGETIADYLNLDELNKHMEAICVYQRSAEDCPWARGNWILDVRLKNDQLLCWRFPIEMSSKFAKKFFAPIVELDKKRMRKMEH
jgi:hypothetical protein